jgi:hypothetical protein
MIMIIIIIIIILPLMMMNFTQFNVLYDYRVIDKNKILVLFKKIGSILGSNII